MSCMHTRVQNQSGKTRTFGYLGRNVRLTAGQEFLFPGDLMGAITGKGRNRRRRTALDIDLESGDLAILDSPCHVMTDVATGHIKVLQVNDDTIETTDPSWGAGSSE